MWKPTTVQDATVAMDLSVALRDLAGRISCRRRLTRSST
jgi:hypothetical protein